MRPSARLAVVWVATLMTGCADQGRRIGVPATDEARRPAAASVRVVNHNWLRATVFVVRDGQKMPLGPVETGGLATFTLPGTAHDGLVELTVDLFGSDVEYQTEPIMIAPGVVIDLTIENHLPLSSYRVSGT